MERNNDGKPIDNSDIGILEFVLSIIYGHECNDIALELIDRFGNVPAVFHAHESELLRVRGITPRAASFFAELLHVQRQALLRTAQGTYMDSERSAIGLIAAYCTDKYRPFDMCISCDKAHRYIHIGELVTEERFRETIEYACNYNAERNIIARFIPYETSEPLVPSAVRLRSLAKLSGIFDTLEMNMIDYIAYTPYKFYSLRRAIFNMPEIVDMTAASFDVYPTLSDITDKIRALYKSITGEDVD